jgi:hypothetical protein
VDGRDEPGHDGGDGCDLAVSVLSTSAMVKPGKAQKSAARSARLSAALRENLKRRKAQARGRAGAEGGEPAAEEAETAGAPDFRRNPGGKLGSPED